MASEWITVGKYKNEPRDLLKCVTCHVVELAADGSAVAMFVHKKFHQTAVLPVGCLVSPSPPPPSPSGGQTPRLDEQLNADLLPLKNSKDRVGWRAIIAWRGDNTMSSWRGGVCEAVGLVWHVPDTGCPLLAFVLHTSRQLCQLLSASCSCTTSCSCSSAPAALAVGDAVKFSAQPLERKSHTAAAAAAAAAKIQPLWCTASVCVVADSCADDCNRIFATSRIVATSTITQTAYAAAAAVSACVTSSAAAAVGAAAAGVASSSASFSHRLPRSNTQILLSDQSGYVLELSAVRAIVTFDRATVPPLPPHAPAPPSPAVYRRVLLVVQRFQFEDGGAADGATASRNLMRVLRVGARVTFTCHVYGKPHADDRCYWFATRAHLTPLTRPDYTTNTTNTSTTTASSSTTTASSSTATTSCHRQTERCENFNALYSCGDGRGGDVGAWLCAQLLRHVSSSPLSSSPAPTGSCSGTQHSVSQSQPISGQDSCGSSDGSSWLTIDSCSGHSPRHSPRHSPAKRHTGDRGDAVPTVIRQTDDSTQSDDDYDAGDGDNDKGDHNDGDEYDGYEYDDSTDNDNDGDDGGETGAAAVTVDSDTDSIRVLEHSSDQPHALAAVTRQSPATGTAGTVAQQQQHQSSDSCDLSDEPRVAVSTARRNTPTTTPPPPSTTSTAGSSQRAESGDVWNDLLRRLQQLDTTCLETVADSGVTTSTHVTTSCTATAAATATDTATATATATAAATATDTATATATDTATAAATAAARCPSDAPPVAADARTDCSQLDGRLATASSGTGRQVALPSQTVNSSSVLSPVQQHDGPPTSDCSMYRVGAVVAAGATAAVDDMVASCGADCPGATVAGGADSHQQWQSVMTAAPPGLAGPAAQHAAESSAATHRVSSVAGRQASAANWAPHAPVNVAELHTAASGAAVRFPVLAGAVLGAAQIRTTVPPNGTPASATPMGVSSRFVWPGVSRPAASSTVPPTPTASGAVATLDSGGGGGGGGGGDMVDQVLQMYGSCHAPDTRDTVQTGTTITATATADHSAFLASSSLSASGADRFWRQSGSAPASCVPPGLAPAARLTMTSVPLPPPHDGSILPPAAAATVSTLGGAALPPVGSVSQAAAARSPPLSCSPLLVPTGISTATAPATAPATASATASATWSLASAYVGPAPVAATATGSYALPPSANNTCNNNNTCNSNSSSIIRQSSTVKGVAHVVAVLNDSYCVAEWTSCWQHSGLILLHHTHCRIAGCATSLPALTKHLRAGSLVTLECVAVADEPYQWLAVTAARGLTAHL